MKVGREIGIAVVAGTVGGLAGAFGMWCWRHRESFRSSASDVSPKSRKTPVCRSSWLQAPRGDRRRVILMATGSVASVKVPELAVSLCDLYEVVVVLTECGERMLLSAAWQYRPAMEAKWRDLQDTKALHVLSDADEWDGYEVVGTDAVAHIELRKWADAVVVAPCSANTMAKAALGLCDNLASCLLRAWDPQKPVVLAPAMNTLMWTHPCTEQHLQVLQSRGYRIINPISKTLACGDVGCGALATLEEIVAVVRQVLQ